MAEPELILIDGSYHLYRAWHALPRLSNRSNEPTGAIYGVTKTLYKIRKQYPAQHIGVIFDARGKNFRHQLYPQYKANRPPMPEELSVQVAPLQELIEALGIPLLCVPDVEADDVIATLAHQAAAINIHVLISSGDKDLAQLVCPQISLINSLKDIVLDAQGVYQKYGVRPEQITDWLALAGDSADNIPGVPRVGAKTAAKWLAKYDTLDAIIAHAEEIPGTAGQNLREHSAQLPLNKTLVTLKTDVELPYGPNGLLMQEPDTVRLLEYYQRWDFHTWRRELERQSPAKSDSEISTGVEIIADADALEHWTDLLRNASLIVVHAQTSGLYDPDQTYLVGMGFCTDACQVGYIPLAHAEPDTAKIPLQTALEKLRPILEEAKLPKLGWRIKDDLRILQRYGIHLRGITHDVMLQSHVLDSAYTPHDLKSLADHWLEEHSLTDYEALTGKGKKQQPFSAIALPDAVRHTADNLRTTLTLHQTLCPRITASESREKIYHHMEMPLLEVLAEMERHGVAIDVNMLAEQSRELHAQLSRIEQDAYRLAGREFLISSPDQVRQVLYEDMQLSTSKKTATGKLSTSESVLQEFAEEHELPALVLEHRGISKLLSTYTESLPQQVNPKTGRIHTSYHQAATITGRLSSSDPNLQNIPIRTAEGRRIRQAFISPPGYLLLAADYSQIELRIMAHMSGDETLINAFIAGKDIHKKTASEVFGTALGQVSMEQRRAAKAINFGLIYGMSDFGLARQLKISQEQAREYTTLYFKRYPAVKAYMDSLRKQAKEHAYVETLFGRQLHLPHIKSANPTQKRHAERAAINAPIQGTAADIIKLAMIAISQRLAADDGLDAKMILQVHDELVFEVAQHSAEKLRDCTIELMGNAAELKVPLLVDIGIGKNWDDAH